VTACPIAHVPADGALFPPKVRAAATHLACQLPGGEVVVKGEPQQEAGNSPATDARVADGDGAVKKVNAPVSRFSAATIARLLVTVEVVLSISARTVARWLKAEKLKPWR